MCYYKKCYSSAHGTTRTIIGCRAFNNTRTENGLQKLKIHFDPSERVWSERTSLDRFIATGSYEQRHASCRQRNGGGGWRLLGFEWSQVEKLDFKNRLSWAAARMTIQQ